MPVNNPGLWCARREIRCAANFFDALTLDRHGGIFDVTSGFDIEQPACFQEDLVRMLALACCWMRVPCAKIR